MATGSGNKVAAEANDEETLAMLGDEGKGVEHVQPAVVAAAGEGLDDRVDGVAVVDPQQVGHVFQQQGLGPAGDRAAHNLMKEVAALVGQTLLLTHTGEGLAWEASSEDIMWRDATCGD